MAEVGVGGGDADGLAVFEAQTGRGGAEDGRQDPTADPTGVHLLKLQEGLVFLWRGGSHRNYTSLRVTR